KRLHMRDIFTGDQSQARFNLKALEPTSFAWTPSKDLLQLGAYSRLGDDEVVGRTCEKWHYLLKAGGAGGSHGCRWNAVEMYWIDLDADGN
ncbi:MAG: hypothetical protein O2910_07395, partial [Proteobacteria bacterium]|nr:hypothetical protein [Pseudomonadota bacterium]